MDRTTVVIHSVYGGDDIMTDMGWDDFLLYVAVDWDVEDRPLFCHLDRQAVVNWCRAHGYDTIECTDAFTFTERGRHERSRWVRTTEGTP